MRAATFAAVLGALLVGHNVGDHLAQTDHQAAHKQLIASRHLTTGGHHAVELSGVTVSAVAVLVPRATRNLVSRWCSYKPLG